MPLSPPRLPACADRLSLTLPRPSSTFLYPRHPHPKEPPMLSPHRGAYDFPPAIPANDAPDTRSPSRFLWWPIRSQDCGARDGACRVVVDDAVCPQPVAAGPRHRCGCRPQRRLGHSLVGGRADRGDRLRRDGRHPLSYLVGANVAVPHSAPGGAALRRAGQRPQPAAAHG